MYQVFRDKAYKTYRPASTYDTPLTFQKLRGDYDRPMPARRSYKSHVSRRRGKGRLGVRSRLRRLRYRRSNRRMAGVCNFGPEIKSADGTILALNTEIPSLGEANSITVMNLVPEGDDPHSRDGRMIKTLSLDISGYFNGVANQAVQVALVRTAIVWDKYPNKSAFDPSDVWKTTGTGWPTDRRRNLSGSSPSRYRVLYDRIWRVDGQAAGVPPQDNNMRIIHIRKKIMKCTRYDDAGSAETDITSGKLVFCIGTGTTLASVNPVGTLYSRIRFTT